MLIRRLTTEDAPALSAMLSGQPADYIQYFIPFAFDEENIRFMLAKANKDLYMGIYWDAALAGFFMLRGWDASYDIPAYGVVIAQQFAGCGLAKVSLETSKAICRMHHSPRLMLKVHPENKPAKHVYETAGFIQTGIDERNNNLIYHYDFKYQ